MPSAKPVRVIDIARKLKLSTSTILDYLADKGYPVDRSHHTTLIIDVLNSMLTEYGAGGDSQIIKKFTDDAVEWEQEHSDVAEKIRSKFYKGKERLQQRKERSKRVIEGRERARIVRQQTEQRKVKFAETMRSVAPSEDNRNGRISPCPLSLEIIHRALALEAAKKTHFLQYLRKLSELQVG